MYADDTQLYISFPPTKSYSPLSLLSSTFDRVYTWFANTHLGLIPSKTEYINIGSPIQRSKLSSSSISIAFKFLEPANSDINLGVIFDSDLSLHKHISSITQTSFYHIRHLRQIMFSIEINSAIILAILHLYNPNLMTVFLYTMFYLQL